MLNSLNVPHILNTHLIQAPAGCIFSPSIEVKANTEKTHKDLYNSIVLYFLLGLFQSGNKLSNVKLGLENVFV